MKYTLNGKSTDPFYLHSLMLDIVKDIQRFPLRME